MDKKDKKHFIFSSFENASILRKFTILFLVSSVVPMTLLFYVYYQYRNTGHVSIPHYYFTCAMILMVLGVFIGYYSIHSLLARVINITKENRKSIEHLLKSEIVVDLDKEENEIDVLSQSFNVVTKQLEKNIRNLEIAKKILQSVMSKVGQGISNMEKIDTFLDLILETMTNALSAKVSTLMILNDSRSEFKITSVFGVNYDPVNPISFKVQGSPFSSVLEKKSPLMISGVFLKRTENPSFNILFGESVLCVPLIYHDKVNGLITLSKADDSSFSEDDIHLTFNLACQTAVALENSKLNRDIEKTYFETISALALAVDAKDKYSRGHLDRVAEYCVMIGRRLGLDETDLNNLRDGARLHDLGKIGIPDGILSKEESLTDEEWIIMRRHPEIGESIIKPVRSLTPLCDLIRHHHEKIDGTGYPDQLKAEEISPLVRILTVADIYDALTTERPYRPKKTRQETYQILRSMKDHIDQDIVEVFLECLETSAVKK